MAAHVACNHTEDMVPFVCTLCDRLRIYNQQYATKHVRAIHLGMMFANMMTTSKMVLTPHTLRDYFLSMRDGLAVDTINELYETPVHRSTRIIVAKTPTPPKSPEVSQSEGIQNISGAFSDDNNLRNHHQHILEILVGTKWIN
jgi:hypothetical protein